MFDRASVLHYIFLDTRGPLSRLEVKILNLGACVVSDPWYERVGACVCMYVLICVCTTTATVLVFLSSNRRLAKGALRCGVGTIATSIGMRPRV